MNDDLAVSLFFAAIAITIIVYIFYMLQVQKTDGEYNILALIMFWRSPTNNHDYSQHSNNNRHSRNPSKIERLEQELLNTDDDEKRRKLLNEIRELEARK